MTVPGVAVLKGGERYELMDEVHISPIPKLCAASDRYLHCLSLRRGSAVLTDVEQASGAVTRRIEHLPPMHWLWCHPSGYSLGYRKAGPIGHPSTLLFLSDSGRLQRSVELPNAVNEVNSGPGVWYVGCRNSVLYAFGVDGARLWSRPVAVPASYFIPGITSWEHSPRLYVSAARGLVGVGGGGRLEVFDSFGHRQWRMDLPRERSTQEMVLQPCEVPTREQLLSKLGLPDRAHPAEVHTGFFRLRANAQDGVGIGFTRELETYDRAETAICEESQAAAIEIVMGGFEPRNSISSVGMAEEQIAVGLMNGRVSVWDYEGILLGSYRVGEGPVSVLLDERRLRASYSEGLLTLFDGLRITGFVNLPEHYAEMRSCGPDVMLWRGSDAWMVNGKGRVLWRAAFARKITSLVVHRFGFYASAGALFAFAKRPQPGNYE